MISMFLLSSPLWAQESETGTIILDTSSFWRVHFTISPPVIKKNGGIEKMKIKWRSWTDWLLEDSPFPQAEWAKPDFDDGRWTRMPAPWRVSPYRGYEKKSPFVALECLRGKFSVGDPAKAGGLALSASYYGGIVVYVNGNEIARGNMPEGKIDMDTLAEDYPLGTFTDAEKKAMGNYRTKAPELEKMRLKIKRKITGVKVPAELLRKGVNVLALELHRAAYSEKDLEMDKKKRVMIDWGNCGVVSVRLNSSGGGVVPNIARPKELQVWNSNPMQADTDMDYGDPNEKLKPIYMVGTKNGAFSGKVVVGSSQTIKGLSAKMGDLKSIAGGVIPASAVQVRYAIPNRRQVGVNPLYLAEATCFDGLEETFPVDVEVRAKSRNKRYGNYASPGVSASCGAVVPVWVTVNVPEDAPVGDYEGKLAITATGAKPVEVPVKIKICEWTLPEPCDFRTIVDIIQSPESVAMQYNVPFWSDEHFKYLEKSMKLLGQVGNKVTYLHLICHTNAGNTETMVRWIEQADGTYKYDFKPLDKYLDLVEKYLKKPMFVCLYVWDTYLENTGIFLASAREASAKHAGKGPLVSVLDPASGKVEMSALPMYSTPEASKPLWKPLIDEIRARLQKRGMEKAMMLGVTTDTQPAKEVVEFWKDLCPGTPWSVHSHGQRGPRQVHGVPIDYVAFVWGRQASIKGDGWRHPHVSVVLPRGKSNSEPLTWFRTITETNVAGFQRGIGRLGADFWPVLDIGKGRLRSLEARYAETLWRHLNISTHLFSPGQNGAISTHRFEMLREGLQESEARVFIETALFDEKLRAKLGDELAKRCRKLLDDRVFLIRRGTNGFWASGAWTAWAWVDGITLGSPAVLGYYWYIGSGWQEESGKLYSTAAEVAEKLGTK